MRIVEAREGFALCEGGGRSEEVDMALLGDLPVGSWVLVFLGVAREELSEERAHQVSDALTALSVALNGGNSDQIDALFPDLANREPELPEFLRQEDPDAEPRNGSR